MVRSSQMGRTGATAQEPHGPGANVQAGWDGIKVDDVM